MQLCTRHRTHYQYVGQSSSSHNEIRLKPLTNDDQRCLEYKVTISPKTNVFEYETIGGFVNHFAVNEPHGELDVVAESVVETLDRNPFESLDLVANDLDWYLDKPRRQEYAEFLAESPFVQFLPEVEAMTTAGLAECSGNTATFLLNLKAQIFNDFAYQPNVTSVHSLLDEVLSLKAGVCQDFSHLMIACCRQAGIPARYVSGYLYLGVNHELLGGTEATHAWIEALVPSGQWIAIDPTNDILVDERYIKVHVGRDYSDVTPVKGVYTGFGTESMTVTVAVQQVVND